jgi:hypothetical protein
MRNAKAITKITYSAEQLEDYWAERGYSRYHIPSHTNCFKIESRICCMQANEEREGRLYCP